MAVHESTNPGSTAQAQIEDPKREDQRIGNLRRTFGVLRNVLYERAVQSGKRLDILDEGLKINDSNPSRKSQIELSIAVERARFDKLNEEQRELEKSFLTAAKLLQQNPLMKSEQALYITSKVTPQVLSKRIAEEFKLLDSERTLTELTRQGFSGGDANRDTLELVLTILPVEELAIRLAGPALRVIRNQIGRINLKPAAERALNAVSHGVEELKSWIRESSFSDGFVAVPAGGGPPIGVVPGELPRQLFIRGASRAVNWGERESKEILGGMVDTPHGASAPFSTDEIHRLTESLDKLSIRWDSIGRCLRDSLPSSGTSWEIANQLTKRIEDAATQAKITPEQIKEIIISNPRVLGQLDSIGSTLTESAAKFGVSTLEYLKIGLREPTLFSANPLGIGSLISQFFEKLAPSPELRLAIMEFLRELPSALHSLEQFKSFADHVRVALRAERVGQVLPYAEPGIIPQLIEPIRAHIGKMSKALGVPIDRYARALIDNPLFQKFNPDGINDYLHNIEASLPELSRKDWIEVFLSKPKIFLENPIKFVKDLKELSNYLDIKPIELIQRIMRNSDPLPPLSREKAERFVSELSNSLRIKESTAQRVLQAYPHLLTITGNEVGNNVRRLSNGLTGGNLMEYFSNCFRHPDRFLGIPDPPLPR